MKSNRRKIVLLTCIVLFVLCLGLIFINYSKYYYNIKVKEKDEIVITSLADVPNGQICRVELSTRKQIISVGSAATITVETTNCNGKTIQLFTDNGTLSQSQINVQDGVSSYKFEVTPTISCKFMTLSSIVDTQYYSIQIYVQNQWVRYSGYCEKNPECTTESCADRKGIDIYYDNQSFDNTRMCYTVLVTRGCIVPSPTTEKACYCNTVSLETAESCVYQENTDSYHKFEIKNTSSEDCNPPEAPIPKGLCKNNNIKSGGNTMSTNICEGKANTLKINDEICDDENKYYRIEAKEEINTEYDMNKDGITSSSLSLKSGESFTFDVLVTSKKQLKGTFYDYIWLSDYEKLEREYSLLKNEIGADFGAKKIDDAKKSSAFNLEDLQNKSARMYELNSLMADMESIVDYYNNNYVNINKFDEKQPAVSLNFDYKSEDNPYTSTALLETVTESYVKTTSPIKSGSIVKSKTSSLYKRTARGTTVYTWDFNYNNFDSPSIWKFAPPNVELDGMSGEIKSSSTKKVVNGGRRIYTEKKSVDSGIYNITLTIEGLGIGSTAFTITNEKCSLNVKETHLNYRVIDVTDKTSSYITGINWINPKYGYNFLGVIRADTWSSAGRNAKTYILSSSKIKEIQNSNSRIGPNAYLGTCDIKSMRDSVSNYLCG